MSILDDLINGLITAPTPIPQDEPIQKYSGFNIAQAPPPKPLTPFEKAQLRTAITSGGLTDLAGIFMGQAPQGRSNAALQTYAGADREIDDQARKTSAFNAEQTNLFNRQREAQQFDYTQGIAQQQAVTAREHERTTSQTEQSRLNREAADARTKAASDAAMERTRMDIASREKIASMKAAQAAAAKTEKPPTEGSIKEATTINSLFDSLNSAESAFNANVKAHPSRMGQLWSGAVSEFAPKIMGHNVGQGVASSAAPEAQFAEGQLNALSAVIDKLRTGNSRFAIQLYNALRPLVPTVGLTKENAAKKFAMLRQNLDAVIRTRLKLAPNQAAGYEDILRAVQEDTLRPGQRIPSPPPPRPGEPPVKRSLEDLADEAMR